MIEKLTFGLFSKEDTKSFMRLMAYVKPYKARIIWALLAIVGVAATESYLAAFIAPLVNQGFALPQAAPQAGDMTTIAGKIGYIKDSMNHMIWGTENKVWVVPLFFITLIVIRGICRFASTYLMTWVSVVATANLRRDLFTKMLGLSSQTMQSETAGAIANRFVMQANASISNASNVFITLTRDTLTVIGLVCVLLYLNWQLCLVVLLMFPALSWLSRYYKGRMKDILFQSQAGIAEINNMVNETHAGQRVIKMFNGYATAEKKYGFIDDQLVRVSKKITQASAMRSPFSELIASIALAVVIFVALWQSQKGVTTIGEFMAFIVAMLQIVSPIKNLSNISIPMQGMFLASDDICGFLDIPNETDNGTQTIERAQGRLKFDHIDVQYNAESRKALDNFNLTINPGEKVAFVGRSGSGKTTAVNLLPRFINPSAGHIYLDNIEIRDLTLKSLRSQFALVSQDVFLFDDTLYNNVHYSRPDATPAEVETALKAANLWDFVQSNPQGWDMPIGANGSQLSGGQRQRVSIARAILKDAPILLLDEATSALDNESERLVQQALERLMQNRTSIIVAHRLTTIEEADRIIVMDEGKIIEQGTHTELLAKGGYYAALQNMPKIGQ
ncbi:lipid A export permease/ATP-binding protein MsbA [Neisseria chenwenguii]|uniref:Lipid A export permease/ATP-binding protein MsbA n=1 Tax=Neisseria chenwenguii TaxID=1853278 RepID=A0A220S0P2_9NEIS|nr:lipid A export permease/ATP-binding protein MsbA [Neisseria chenwenguii]ASK26972.1 lipid A export permease/ATP-binding protein MsbA [Neisseria chenwenguii]ROV56126.1 lipid A export permease/ATP-binding protein MsbA [Neisseria chenwenguii]